MWMLIFFGWWVYQTAFFQLQESETQFKLIEVEKGICCLMYLVEWYEIVFLGSKIAKYWSCIWLNLITENSIKILASGVVGSRCSDKVSNLSLHMSQLSFLLWSRLHSQASSPQTEERLATLGSQPLCSLGQLKKKKKAPLSHWFQGKFWAEL